MRHLKKILVVISAIAVLTGCATVKTGSGKGYSDNEQIARDKADMNALVDAARQNKVAVTEESRMESVDTDGVSSTTYTGTRTLTSNAVFKDSSFKRTKNRRGRMFVVTSKSNAKIVEE